MSEDVAVRFIVVDAMQRYQAADMAKKTVPEKVATFQQLLKDATRDNGLIDGPERVAVISEAWARLLKGQEPAGIVSFLENETLNPLIKALPLVQPEAKGLTMMKVVGFMLSNGSSLVPTNKALKQAAQDAGLIDYKSGDSMPKTMERLAKQVTAERNGSLAPMIEGHGLPASQPASQAKTR